MRTAFGRERKRGPPLSRPSASGSLNIPNQLSPLSSSIHALSLYSTAKMMKRMFTPHGSVISGGPQAVVMCL